MDYWVDYASASVSAGVTFEPVCGKIDEFLALRTYLVGYTLTVADLALWGQLQGKLCKLVAYLHFPIAWRLAADLVFAADKYPCCCL